MKNQLSLPADEKAGSCQMHEEGLRLPSDHRIDQTLKCTELRSMRSEPDSGSGARPPAIESDLRD